MMILLTPLMLVGVMMFLSRQVFMLTLAAVIGLSFVATSHTVVVLVRLELMVMLLILILGAENSISALSLGYIFILFCVAVMDAVMGLALLSQLIRVSNKDLTQMDL